MGRSRRRRAGVVLVRAIVAALCVFGPVSVQKAVGAAGRGQPAAEAPAPARPQAPQLIAATGYDPEEMVDGRGFVQPPPEVAYELNRARPVSDAPNPAAKPFAAAWRDDFDQTRAVDCLTAAVYYEAASEGEAGQRAVAQVVLNRVRHPAFAKSVCAVVFEGAERTTGCQFTFACDGSLSRKPEPALWAKARKVAAAALSGSVYKPVGYATHYHTVWVLPYWSPSLVKLATIGQHIFYRWNGGWGEPAAFRASYVPAEAQTDIRRLAAVAPVAEVRKAAFVIAEARPAIVTGEAASEAQAPALVSVKPLEAAAVARPIALPADLTLAPRPDPIEQPATALGRPARVSRIAAPLGW